MSGRIFVIGDSHIGLGEGAEKSVVAWCDRLEKHAPAALYLNGDLFHYLIAHPKFFTPAVGKVFERFKALRDNGVPIHYVEGNRDFFLRGSFVEDAVTDVADRYDIVTGGKKYLIIHGDMINDRDWKYRFWRRASKNPVSKFGINLIPRKLARNFVDSVEKRLSSSNFKHKSRLPVELMEEYGRKRGSEGYNHVVFGHFHEKKTIPAGDTTVSILPAWFEEGEAMTIDPVTGDYDWTTV